MARRLHLVLLLLCLMAVMAETNIRMNVRPLKGLGRLASMRLRGGADDSDMEEVEETVVHEVSAVPSAPMTRKEIDAEVERLLSGEMPDFVKVGEYRFDFLHRHSEIFSMATVSSSLHVVS
jgi:hypothetical protein